MNNVVVLGLIAGLVIGGLYAWWQLRALARHERLMRERGGTAPLATMVPGSLGRVALLLVALVLVQVLLPPGVLLWVTIGVGIAYGAPLVWRLKRLLRGRGERQEATPPR